MAKVSKKAYWNQATVKALLLANDRAVEDALLVVYNNQTPHEQVAESTTVENGKGFSGTNAQFGTSLAKQILERRVAGAEGNALSQKQIVYGRKIALLHWGQFAEALNDERKEQGLPTEAPKEDRFTWAPGDLHKVPKVDTVKADPERTYEEPLFEEEPKPAKVEYGHELFEEDEPELRNLVELMETCKGADKAYVDEVLASREWTLYMEVISEESQAWLRLVYAAEVLEWPEHWGTIPLLGTKFRAAQERREVVLGKLGLDEATRRGHGAAAMWQGTWGTTRQAAGYWLASANGKKWVAENVPATVVAEVGVKA